MNQSLPTNLTSPQSDHDSKNEHLANPIILENFLREHGADGTPPEIQLDLFWLTGTQKNYFKVQSGDYEAIPGSFDILLSLAGVPLSADPAQRRTEVKHYKEQFLYQNSVVYAGGLGGCKPGLLHTDDGRAILVQYDSGWVNPIQGNWEPLREFLCGMLCPEEYTALLCWLKIALQDLKKCREAGPWKAELLPSQSLIIIGEPGAGKTLLKSLLRLLFGGKSADPYNLCAGLTRFAEELIAAPLLVMDDSTESVHPRHRTMLTQTCKSLQVGEDQKVEAKFGSSQMLKSFRRIVILANEDSLDMLPQPKDSYMDKMMLFYARKSKVVEDFGGADKDAWRQSLKDSLPAFSFHLLNEFKIPDELYDSRYGIRAWHNTELLSTFDNHDELEFAAKLIKFTVSKIQTRDNDNSYAWGGGLARELYSHMLAHVGPIQVDKLVNCVQKLGTLLQKLSSRYPANFIRGCPTRGITKWSITFKHDNDEQHELKKLFAPRVDNCDI